MQSAASVNNRSDGSELRNACAPREVEDWGWAETEGPGCNGSERREVLRAFMCCRWALLSGTGAPCAQPGGQRLTDHSRRCPGIGDLQLQAALEHRALRPTGVPPCQMHPWASPERQRRHRDDLPAGVNVDCILGMQPQLGVTTTAPCVGLVHRSQVAFWAAAAPLRQREGQQACAQGGSKPLTGSRVEGRQRWNCRAAGIAELKMTRPGGHLSPGS